MADNPGAVADEIDKYVEEVGVLSDAELLSLGHTAINVIVLRTKQGKDADHKPFVPYSAEYAERRKKSGRSATTVDLAVSGHMQQAIVPTVHPGEVHLQFMNHAEEVKADAHNQGVHKREVVKGHTVSNYTRKVQRYTKNGKPMMRGGKPVTRKQEVQGHVRPTFMRTMNLPKREWFEVRHPHDVALIEDAVERAIQKKPTP